MKSKEALAKEIGLRIKEFAITNFKTVSALAKAIDMNQSQLQNYISRNNNQPLPGAEILIKLESVGCDINWLLTGKTKSDYPNLFKKYNINNASELNRRLTLYEIINKFYNSKV